ncbi:MAG: tetratricopeptide repeat protein [Desulfobacteraceae bacterium]|nr:tetratricopeptide repeat protein [Desulfobacteraceae bacterium]
MTAEEKDKRKLSAILSADVKGYSRLMTEDETLTIKTLKEYRNIMSGIITQHNGRVVDAPGDNIMAEFASIVNAVKCSVEIQTTLKSKNTDVPINNRLEFRIGVNIGDVVQDGDRLYGEGVNIAARIEGLADPGGVCISRGAYDHIRNKLKLGYEYIGDHNVKNIKNPVRVYRVLMEPGDVGKLIGKKSQHSQTKWLRLSIAVVTILAGFVVWQFYHEKSPPIETASVDNMAFPLPEKPSIAVLAFDNMTGDKEQNYFCDGLSEEIISALSSVPEMFVIARNSAFSYKGKSVKVQQISEELGVQYVLEGSVRKSGGEIRITAQLIDALNGHHLWSESYDRNIEDLFVLQEDIALKVITELQVKLIGREDLRLRAPCSKNLKAYLTYLKAHDHFYRFTREDNAAARRLLEKAIGLDPSYACAYSMLGGTYRLDVYLGTSESPKQSFSTAKKMLEKAIYLNPSLAGPRAVLASMYSQMGQYEQALIEAEKALAISPDLVLANGEMGNVLYSSGRSEEAIIFCKKAIRLDPFSTTYFRALGVSYLLSGQSEQAIQILNKLIDRKPTFLPAHLTIAAAYSAAGLIGEAKAAASAILKMAPKFNLKKYSKKLAFKNPADKDFIISNLLKAGLPEKPSLPLPEKPSIAVLPFDNMSGEKEQEYFIDGITEDIITSLSKTEQLFVIAQNSTSTYKSKPVKMRQVSEQLGVRYVVEGSVRKFENQIRITVQLIDATTGHNLWAERYDRDLKDIFALQDEITMKIVTALQVKLTEGEQARMSTRRYKTLNTKLKSMEARSVWEEGTAASRVRYGQVAQELIDMEPESEIGYTSLGWHYWRLAMYGKSPQVSIAKGFELAQKALSMDEYNPFPYALLSNLHYTMRQYDKAIAAGKQSVALIPNGAYNHCALGITLSFAGKLDEAIEHFKHAIRLDPFPAYYYFTHLGRCYMHKGQYEEALSEFKKAHHINKDTTYNNTQLAAIYALLGRQEEASAVVKKVLETEPNYSVKNKKKAWAYKNKADLKFLMDALRKSGFPE